MSVSYGQKSVVGWSKSRMGTRETEVRREGWCEGGLGQQRNDGGGCASMRERSKRVERPGTYVAEFSFTRPWLLGPLLFRTAFPCSGGYHLERGGMQLHDAVGINCKKGATTEYYDATVKYMG